MSKATIMLGSKQIHPVTKAENVIGLENVVKNYDFDNYAHYGGHTYTINEVNEKILETITNTSTGKVVAMRTTFFDVEKIYVDTVFYDENGMIIYKPDTFVFELGGIK